MKSLKNLLDKKNISQRRDSIDKKSAESAFFHIAEKEWPNFSRADIQNVRFESGKIFLQTVHPAFAAEIWRKREKIKKEVNKFLESDTIQEIKVK